LARSYGYDPLGLSAKGGKEDVEKYRAYELIHARWAMLGAAGCIAPEVLGKAGVIPAETGLVRGPPLPGQRGE